MPVNHPVSLFMQNTSICICGEQRKPLQSHFISFLFANVSVIMLANTSFYCINQKIRSVLNYWIKDRTQPELCAFDFPGLPSVSASPSSCPLCPAASFLSIGRRSRMDWCKTSDLPSRHLYRQTKQTRVFMVSEIILQNHPFKRRLHLNYLYLYYFC